MATLSSIIPVNSLDYSLETANFVWSDYSTTIVYSRDDLYYDVYRGSISTDGTSGTVTEYNLTEIATGTTYYYLSGLSVDLATAISFLNANDGEGLANLLFSGNDSVTVSNYDDVIAGYLGSDTIQGGGGNDAVYGGRSLADPLDSADALYGGAGSDTIYGNAGNDLLFGGTGIFDPTDSADLIYGGLGADTVYGNGGNDSIIGSTGNDVMYGGAGDDHYIFGSGEGSDVVAQFTGAGSASGDVIAIYSGVNSITTTAGILALISYSGGNAVLDLGTGNTVTIMGVEANSLTASDFLIV